MTTLNATTGLERYNTATYDGPTMFLHWLTATLVILLFGTSLTWNYVFPHDRGVRPVLENSHVSLGIALAVVIVARVIWRVTGGRHLRQDADVSGTLARLVHALLYILLISQVVLGFVFRWSQGEDFTFFGLFDVPALLPKNDDLADQLENIHNIVGWTIAILAFGHACAALFHHYVLKDRILGRMTGRRA